MRPFHRRWSAAALAALLLAAPLALAATGREPGILGPARAAFGYDRLRMAAHGMEWTGEADTSGVPLTLRLALHADGRWLRESRGRLATGSGWDGRSGWASDWSGTSRRLEMRELEEEQLLHWTLSGRWLEREGPFAVTAVPGEPDQLRLRLKQGRGEGLLALDPATHLPVSLTPTLGASGARYRFDEPRRLGGVWFPARVVREGPGGAVVWNVRSARFLGEPFPTDRPPPDPARTAWSPDAPAEVEVRKMRTGHLLVHPKVNGEDHGWFILDSGAGSLVIDKKVAEALRLERFGRVAAVGVGGTVETGFRAGSTFELGPVTIRNPVFVELDLEFLSPVFGLRVAGIAGYDVFTRVVAALEPASPRLSLHRPGEFRLPEGAEWGRLHLNNRLPVVEGRFEGNRDGLFTLDTGANGNLTFHAPAVREHMLLAGRETQGGQGGGVGGRSPVRSGRIEFLELGGKRFRNIPVQFSEATTGAFAEPYITGNLGSGVLRHFRIVFDYPRGRVAFLPLPEPAG